MSAEWILDGALRNRQSVTSEWERTGPPLIDGVILREVKNVLAPDGTLVEIFRHDWQLGGNVAQVFRRSLSPRSVSAWHAHEHTTDRIFVYAGRAKVVLYDSRGGSPTKGSINELIMGDARPALLVIPPRIWHGVQNLSSETSSLLNLVDRAYEYENPDHWRVPAGSPEIPYRFDGQ